MRQSNQPKRHSRAPSLARNSPRSYFSPMHRLFIALGTLLILLGLLWPVLRRFPWGRLPGDILIERPGFTFAFPITTCIVVSLVLSLIFWVLRR
ncbi:MAG: hypothetical protein JG774_2091 [Desulfomicrobiaceae bacterium]|nr:hypothetical protein [Desulfomicrobiaceae bacterium]